MLIQAFDVNMNPTDVSISGCGAARPGGIFPNGLSTIQAQVSGFKGQFIQTEVTVSMMWIFVYLAEMYSFQQACAKNLKSQS